MEFIYVVDHALLKEGGVYEGTAIWCQGQIFKHESVVKLWVFDDHDDVFNPNTKFTFLVVAGLVGDAHSFFELDAASTWSIFWLNLVSL